MRFDRTHVCFSVFQMTVLLSHLAHFPGRNPVHNAECGRHPCKTTSQNTQFKRCHWQYNVHVTRSNNSIVPQVQPVHVTRSNNLIVPQVQPVHVTRSNNSIVPQVQPVHVTRSNNSIVPQVQPVQEMRSAQRGKLLHH